MDKNQYPVNVTDATDIANSIVMTTTLVKEVTVTIAKMKTKTLNKIPHII